MLQQVQAVLEHVLLCKDNDDTILVMLLAHRVRQHHKLKCHHCTLPGQIGLMVRQHSFLSD